MSSRDMLDYFKVYRTIGDGGTAYVKKGVDSNNGDAVALKILKEDYYEYQTETAKDLFDTEKEAIKSLDHPNILTLKEANWTGKFVSRKGDEKTVAYMAFEFCSNSELFDFVSETGELTEDEARFYFK